MDEDWYANEIQPKKQIKKAHMDSIECIDFNPKQSHQLASGSHDKLVKVWDVSQSKELMTLKGHKNGVWAIKFSNDGKKLFSGSVDKQIRVWDSKNGKLIQILSGHQNSIYCMCLNVSETKLMSGDKDGKLLIWDLGKMELEKTIKATKGIIYTIANLTEELFILTDDMSSIYIYDSVLFTIKATIKSEYNNPNVRIQGNAILPLQNDKFIIIAAYRDKFIRQWQVDQNTLEYSNSLEFQAHFDGITSMAYQGNRLASGGRDSSGRIWDVNRLETKHKLFGSLMGHTDNISSMQFMPDQVGCNILATCSWDESINLYYV